ncbi:MAG: glutamate formimidoyltransferase [Anaerolineales bacterium]|nr:glutamate formimidoyltransferase [Anaerolineales bacterium]
MAGPLVECVPNFSEGCDGATIGAILSAARAVPGACLLDSSGDRDHNRTVVTLAGDPAAMLEAAFAAVRRAAERIDLRRHTGVHPRIGAADVVPFIPLQGASMEDCAELARALGRRIGDELEIPVYLYGEAAARPERKNLSAIRRGGYEGLAAAIGSDPARRPDFGPARLGPAGAAAVGARGPLIAFNVYLKTGDVEIARAVAEKIRASSGGLPALKALGLPVGGLAQVSMNLTDYRRTSVRQAFEAVRAEAASLGAEIEKSELVGLIPHEAAAGWDPENLRLTDFSDSRILEVRLREVGLLS